MRSAKPYLRDGRGGRRVGAASTRAARPRRRRQLAPRRVAAQVEFERQSLKPGGHFIGSRVETGRFQAMGKLDSQLAQPPPPRSVSSGAISAGRCRRACRAYPPKLRTRRAAPSGRAVQAELESKGLKPVSHFVSSMVETRRFQAQFFVFRR